MKTTPILFVDLDGTVRLGPTETGKYVNTAADVELFDGMVDLLKFYKSRGWRIVSVSNQGGVALGYSNERDVAKAMSETNRLCAGLFDRMQWCMHHPLVPLVKGMSDNEHKEMTICLCRKPRIGMLVAAMISMSAQFRELYKPYDCLFVGDMDEDKECAIAANIPFMWASTWREKGPIESR